LIVGSVKTNIGHLEAAAGIAGLIKLVLSLQHQTIPAHLHFREPSPHISWSDWPVSIPTKTMAWQPIRGRRIAGVSSFGFSGTNAHVVLEEAPVPPVSSPQIRSGVSLLAISARDERALAQLAARYAAALEMAPDSALPDICHTANS